MGKGSRPRPCFVSEEERGSNFDAIFRKPKPRACLACRRLVISASSGCATEFRCPVKGPMDTELLKYGCEEWEASDG